MPKAKLVTRTASTSSVTTDNIPKNTGLTNAELDSNFLNLRDQGFRIRTDDSTQHTVNADTQVNFVNATVTESGGDLTINTGGLETVTALTSASSISVDCSLGNVFTVTLQHNATFTLNNFSTGQSIAIKIKQDGTGGRTATFSGVKFNSSFNTLSSGANKIDFITIFNDGTDKLASLNVDYA